MTAELESESPLEIAHVLFTDIVGYSKLLSNEQRELIQLLNEIVCNTQLFRLADAAGKLVRLPTGDGMALAFFSTVDAPVRCAREISGKLREYPKLPLRMGINSGPVDEVIDVNGRRNVTGAGINLAQRVMDCGDAGHILIAKRVADDLAQYGEWRAYLHDLGEFEVKHSVRVNLVNLYGDNFGNAQLPEKLKRAECERVASAARQKKIKRRRILIGGAAVITLLLLLGAGTWTWQRRIAIASGYKAGTATLLEKSIAVLPFENFEDKESSYFADGVQDDILTDLAKVADLKVISRRSVAQYRGSTQGIREIGQALQVAYVLEGTVRKIGEKIRITAQLIDTRTEAEKWAEKYERDLADVFAIQSQISQTIVAQLKAALSPAEKAAIEKPPTDNLEAYDLYLQARGILRAYGVTVKTTQEAMPKAEKLLEEAVAKDPKFVLAWCLLAEVQWSADYAENLRPERGALAEASLTTALKLAPDSGEVHLALATYYWGILEDKKRGEEEFAIAARKLPNSVDVASGFSQLAFDQGRWKEALDYALKATRLDPRDPDVAQQLIELYADFRRYSDADKLIDRTISMLPPEATGPLWRRKGIYARDRGNTKAAMAAFDAHPLRNSGLAGLNFEIAQVLVFEHRFDEAVNLIESLEQVARAHNALPRGDNTFAPGHEQEVIGIVRRAQGQNDKARQAFAASEKNFTAWLQKKPDEAMALALRAVSIAGLGRKEEAVHEARHAMEIWPPTRDRGKANEVAEQAAIVYAWTGDYDAAIRQLQAIVSLPHSVEPGDLKLNPRWDDLRKDPRFDKIIMDAGKPVKIE